MEIYSALLTDRPKDVDLHLLEDSQYKQFVMNYFNQFGELPSIKTFENEFNIELPKDFAPWQFYADKLKEELFIKEAVPALEQFNDTYASDQTSALLTLRDKLAKLIEPTHEVNSVSIINDTSRFERFRQTDGQRILTGLKPLDDLSGGLSRKDDFMIISARLGVGKSWVALAIAVNMAVNGYRVGVYSGEMTPDEVGARADSFISHISNFALTRGREIDLTEHRKKLAEIKGDLYVLHPSQLRRNAQPSDLRRFAKDRQLDCLVIDQISLMMPDGRASQMWSTHERVAELSLQLKTLQQELQIPIVAVNQLNRDAAQQEADASNLAGSDRLGQDATLIVALKKKDDMLQMKILKSRSFRLPDAPLEFTWDIDKGILEPRLSAMDAVRAKVTKAKAVEATKALEPAPGEKPSSVGDDEIW